METVYSIRGFCKKKVVEGCEGIAFTNDDVSDKQHVFSPARRHISSHCQPSSPLLLSHKHLRAAAGSDGVKVMDKGPPADTLRTGQVCRSYQDTSGPRGHADGKEAVG